MISLALFAAAVVFYTMSQSANFKDSDGWKNKYKQPLEAAPKTFYYRLFKLKYHERFPLSGSFLVAWTDKYHATQFIFKALLCTSIVMYSPWLGYWDAGVYFVLFGIVFTITYRIVR